jgi:hypothetical protein
MAIFVVKKQTVFLLLSMSLPIKNGWIYTITHGYHRTIGINSP